MIWREAKAPGLPGRGGWSSPYWASYVESEKNHKGQGIQEDWKVEACRKRGEKETVGVFEKTLGWSFGRWCCSFGECWDFPGYGVQTQEDYQYLLRKQGRVIAL